MLKTILGHIDFLTEQIEMLDKEVAERVSSNHERCGRLGFYSWYSDQNG